MMKFYSRLPYFVYSAKPNSQNPILLFLHGIGESFVKQESVGWQDDGAFNLEISHRNLLQQGPPKYLNQGILSLEHPLLNSFTLVAPQLPDRKTLWSEVSDDVNKIIKEYLLDGQKLYVMGFSKGGLGAFQIADKLGANAMITIDASPLDLTPEAAFKEWGKPTCIYWSFYANYDVNERFRKIQVFNEALTAPLHTNGFSRQPTVSFSIRSQIIAPEGYTPLQRHTWLCDRVTESKVPFQWLLEQ